MTGQDVIVSLGAVTALWFAGEGVIRTAQRARSWWRRWRGHREFARYCREIEARARDRERECFSELR